MLLSAVITSVTFPGFAGGVRCFGEFRLSCGGLNGRSYCFHHSYRDYAWRYCDRCTSQWRTVQKVCGKLSLCFAHSGFDYLCLLQGKFVKHPLLERRLVIVADTYVDMAFGSGAVKITPAHDANDYAIGERHKLEFINIMDDEGTLNSNCGSFAGMKRFDVRMCFFGSPFRAWENFLTCGFVLDSVFRDDHWFLKAT